MWVVVGVPLLLSFLLLSPAAAPPWPEAASTDMPPAARASAGTTDEAHPNQLGRSSRTETVPVPPPKPEEVTQVRVSEAYGKLPLHFEANQGQTDQQVQFLARGRGYTLFLTPTEAVLALQKPPAAQTSPRTGRPARAAAPEHRQGIGPAVLRLQLLGANPQPHMTGLEELPGKVNYFIGNDPARWRTNLPTYAKVQYQEIYPGVDAVYYGAQRQLEFDFVVAPGADPSAITLGVEGADTLEVDAQGDLLLHIAAGDLRLHKPVLYQEIEGVRQEIAGGYGRKGAQQVGFQVAAYDAS
jgi:hypothetical protein